MLQILSTINIIIIIINPSPVYLAQASPQNIYSLNQIIMIFKTLIELYQGKLSLVQYVKYSNGKTVKRVLDKQGLPVAIIEE